MGMHRNLQHPSFGQMFQPRSVATMQRTWACCYILDRYTACNYGRPCIVRDRDCDDSSFLALRTQADTFPQYRDDLVTLSLHYKLAQVYGVLCTLGNAPRPEDRDKLYEEGIQLLLRWTLNLPGRVQRLFMNVRSMDQWTGSHDLLAMFFTACLLVGRQEEYMY